MKKYHRETIKTVGQYDRDSKTVGQYDWETVRQWDSMTERQYDSGHYNSKTVAKPCTEGQKSQTVGVRQRERERERERIIMTIKQRQYIAT